MLKEADFAIADLTINAIRETVVDFTQQFYATKVAILFKTGALRWTYLLEPLQVGYISPEDVIQLGPVLRVLNCGCQPG